MSFPRSSYTGFPFNEDPSKEDFPFNRQRPRDADFQSTLDDIAQRHPKFAKHLTNIGKPRSTRSRFPFEDDDIDFDELTKKFYNPKEFHPEETFHHPSSFQEPQSQAHCSKTEPQAEPPKKEEKEVGSNLQQSSTTDLGQRQDPIDDRNQRSSSAPPGGESAKRYTSSINIPINNPPENMAQHNQDKPLERIIPIQVEGRDDPVISKNVHIPQQSQPQQMFNRPDDHFGRPSFGSRHNFPTRDPFSREEIPIPVQREFPKTQSQPQPQQQQFQHPPQQQQQHFQPQQQQHPQQPQPQQMQQEQHAEQKPEPPKPSTPIDQIQMIKEDVSKLMEEVEKFSGKTKDKEYLFLDEMLTRNLLKLDNIDTQGQENIRASRKEAIKCIQRAISVLENKVTANASEAVKNESNSNEEMVTEQTQEASNASSESNETQQMSNENMSEQKTNADPPSQQESSEKMDTSESADAQPNLETRAVLVTNPENQETESKESKDATTEKTEKKIKKEDKK